jgi:hypothetical protein
MKSQRNAPAKWNTFAPRDSTADFPLEGLCGSICMALIKMQRFSRRVRACGATWERKRERCSDRNSDAAGVFSLAQSAPAGPIRLELERDEREERELDRRYVVPPTPATSRLPSSKEAPTTQGKQPLGCSVSHVLLAFGQRKSDPHSPFLSNEWQSSKLIQKQIIKSRLMKYIVTNKALWGLIFLNHRKMWWNFSEISKFVTKTKIDSTKWALPFDASVFLMFVSPAYLDIVFFCFIYFIICFKYACKFG